MLDANIHPKKKPATRLDRNTPEANAEENSNPYDELGPTEEEIRKRKQKGSLSNEGPGPVPTDGS
jgi:hypothetical protein